MPSFNQNVNINRHDTESPDQWGFTRHLSSTNVFETSAFNGQITFPFTGDGVDIIIQEGMFNHTLSEFNDSNGNSRFVKYQWDQHFVESFPINYDEPLYFSDHATHVAGTAAGLTYGWAKDARLYSCPTWTTQKAINAGLPYNHLEQIYWFDAIKKFHEAKIAAGINRPTVVNASWGQRNYYTPITKINFRGELIDDPENFVSYPYGMAMGSDAEASKKNKITRFGLMGRTDGKIADSSNQFFKDGVKSMTDAGIFYIKSAGNGLNKIDEPGGVDFNNYMMTGSATDLSPTLMHIEFNKRRPVFYNRPNSNSSDGTVVVGNLNNRFYWDSENPFSPPEYNGVFDLTAVNPNDEIISDSSERGPGVDILAAGSKIISVLSDGLSGVYSGTSMASPQIAGMTALLLEKWGNFRPKQLKKYWREYGISSSEIADLSLTPFISFLSAGDPNHFGYQKRALKIGLDSSGTGAITQDVPFWLRRHDSHLFACGRGKIAYLNLDVDITTLDDYEQNSYTDPTITVDTEINLSNKNFNTNKQNLSGYRYLKIVGSESIDSNFEFKINEFYNRNSLTNFYSTVSSNSAFPFNGGILSHLDFEFGDLTTELSTFSDNFTFSTNGSGGAIPNYYSTVEDLTASWDYHEIQASATTPKISYISSRSLESETIRLTGSEVQRKPDWASNNNVRSRTVANAFDGTTGYVWQLGNALDAVGHQANFAILDMGPLSGYEYLHGNNSINFFTTPTQTPPDFIYIYGKNTLSSVLDDDWELLGKISYPAQDDRKYNENTEVTVDGLASLTTKKYFTNPNDGETTTFNGVDLPRFLPDRYDQNTIIDLDTPSYNISGPVTIVEDGNNNTYTIATANIANGTELHWSINGTTADFTEISGPVTITNDSGTFYLAAIADSLTEINEPYTISLRTGSTTGPVVATYAIFVVNTSSSPSSSTYIATSVADNVDEGSSLTINVQTTHVSDETELFYKVTGVELAEFVQGSGSFFINTNSGSFSITPVADSTTEGDQTFQVTIYTGSVGGTIVAVTDDIIIKDTSQTPPPAFTPDYTILVDYDSPGKYVVLGNDRNGTVTGYSNPPLKFNAGDKVRFSNSASSNHPLYIKTVQGTGTGDQATGVSGAGTETVDWTVTSNGTYYYQCSIHDAMHGDITVGPSSSSSSSSSSSDSQGVLSQPVSPKQVLNIFANFDTTAVIDPEREYYNLPKNELPVLNQITASTRLQINPGPVVNKLVFSTSGIDGIGYNDKIFDLDTYYFQNQNIYFTVRVKTTNNYPAKFVKNLTLGNTVSDDNTIDVLLKDSDNNTLNCTISSDFGELSSKEFGGFFKGVFKYNGIGNNLKLHATAISNGTPLSASSNSFNISPLSGTKEFRKINEDNNQRDNFISYLYQPNLKENQAFFTKFLGQIVGDDSDASTLGVKVYEKISNFLLNSNDMDYANIDNLISNLKLIDSNINKFSDQYPASLKRIVDFFSINRSKLRPTLNNFNQNFDSKGRPTIGSGKNLGPEITISDTLSGGDNFKPIVALEKFSGSYTLLTTDPTSSFEFRNLGVNRTFQLSSYNTRWGWSLSLPQLVDFINITDESGNNLLFQNNFKILTESNKFLPKEILPEYYTFYQYISTTDDSNIFSFYDYKNKYSNLDTTTLSGINNCIDEIVLQDVYTGTNLI